MNNRTQDKLPAGWREVRLGEVAEITMGQSPKSEFYNDKGNGLPFLQGSAEFNEKYPTYKKHSSQWNREAEVGSILMSVRAPVGDLNIAINRCAIGRGLSSIVGKNHNTNFIYFFLKNYAKELDRQAVGTVFTSINKIDLHNLKINLPPLSEQKAIAHILGSLDDKIELNRHLNHTLEEMAQALFKSWFVDFDPVIDNALIAGNPIPAPLQKRAANRKQALQYGSANRELAQHFPAAFVYHNKMGYIPQGWEVKSLGELATTTKGKSYKSSELKKSKTALVTLKSFKRGGGYRLDGLKEYTGSYKLEQEVFAGELIIAQTDVTQAADVIGKPALVIANSNYEHLVISLDVMVLRPNDEKTKYYIYELAKTNIFQAHIYANSTGTTVLHLHKEALSSFSYVFPQKKLFEKYANLADSFFKKTHDLIQQNQTLTQLRDTLLPKLISGTIRITDADNIITELHA